MKSKGIWLALGLLVAALVGCGLASSHPNDAAPVDQAGSGGAAISSGGRMATGASGGRPGSGEAAGTGEAAGSGAGGSSVENGGAGGSAGDAGDGGTEGGVAASGGRGAGGGASGGAAIGGAGTGGAETGGAGTGGAAIGGAGTGGQSLGGAASGGGVGEGTGGTPLNGKLNGFLMEMPCLRDLQADTCSTFAATCPAADSSDPALGAVRTTDESFALGGTPGQSYTITLHVQGVVESNTYAGGLDANSSSEPPRANGLYTGGAPSPTTNRNVFMIRVTDPGTTTGTDYFLNSIQPPAPDGTYAFGIDFVAQIKAQGGATIRLVASDTNCSMSKNCTPSAPAGGTCSNPVILANLEPEAGVHNPNVAFDRAYNGQWLVLTVKGVTSP